MASYVGAVYDWDTDKVLVWERDGAERYVKTYDAPHYFYVKDPEGEHTSLFGDRLKRLDFNSADEERAAYRLYRERFESDISPLYKVLMNNYYDVPVPNVHYAFLDIEVDVCIKPNGAGGFGFPHPTNNPYAPINAVTIYQSWTGKYLTYVVPPLVNGVKWNNKFSVDDIYAELDNQIKLGNLTEGVIPEISICQNEVELLTKLIGDIQDADIISGWNSEFFDLPYIMQRAKLVVPRLVHKMCFIGASAPKERVVNKFGTEEKIYALSGRTHIDYLDAFKKFTFEGRESYSLGNILSQEVGIGKLHYDGNLEELYKGTYYPNASQLSWQNILEETDELKQLNLMRSYAMHWSKLDRDVMVGSDDPAQMSDGELEQFISVIDDEVRKKSFAMFTLYNARDVSGLVDLDEKFKFIQLINQMAHENVCLFENMLGTVKYVESGLTARAHYVHNMIVPDKKVMTDGEKVEGAVVLNPHIGIHEWVGSVDLNSLYPSVIRSLNMSIETYVGQFTEGEKDWRGIIDGDSAEHVMVDVNGEAFSGTSAEWKDILKSNKWVISAYGTVFNQGGKHGLLAETLTFWFAERKRLQAEKKKWGKVADELKSSLGIQLSDEILQQLSV